MNNHLSILEDSQYEQNNYLLNQPNFTDELWRRKEDLPEFKMHKKKHA